MHNQFQNYSTFGQNFDIKFIHDSTSWSKYKHINIMHDIIVAALKYQYTSFIVSKWKNKIHSKSLEPSERPPLMCVSIQSDRLFFLDTLLHDTI